MPFNGPYKNFWKKTWFWYLIQLVSGSSIWHNFNSTISRTSTINLTCSNTPLALDARFFQIQAFFIRNAFFFSTQPRCWLTFPWIEHQMLLRCYILIFIMINHIISWKQTYLLFGTFAECILLSFDDKGDVNNFK